MNTIRLLEFRKKAKLSQRDIAERMNMSQANYWLWEKGKSYPNAKQIKQLCYILKCTPNDLFGFTGVHIITSDEVFKD